MVLHYFLVGSPNRLYSLSALLHHDSDNIALFLSGLPEWIIFCHHLVHYLIQAIFFIAQFLSVLLDPCDEMHNIPGTASRIHMMTELNI